MTFIREFKVIFPVEDNSILKAALDNMFNLTDVKQLSMVFTPTCEDRFERFCFNVQLFYFDDILSVTKKLCKAVVCLSEHEYESLVLGNDEGFANMVMMNMFPRFPDIMVDQEFISNL